MAAKKAPVTIDHVDQNDEYVHQVANHAAEHSQKIMATFGEGLPYDQSRIVHEARFYMSTSAEAMLEAGKRLVVLKEHEPHGDFTRIVEAQLGLSARTARSMMQAAIKYSSPALESKRQALAVLDKTKLFELMTEDDESLAELAEGGTVAGLTLDDIDRMSSRQLRIALRKAHEENEDQQRVLESKNQKIDDQSKKINKIRRQAPDETVMQMRTEISAMQSNIEFEIRTNFFSAINELQEQEGEDHNEYIKAQLTMLKDAITHLHESFIGEAWEE